MGSERRRHHRYRIDMPIILHVGGGGHTHPCRAWDVSQSGIFVLLNEPVMLGVRVELALIDEARDATLFLTGQVAHISPQRGIGVQFSELSTRVSGSLQKLLSELASTQAPLPAPDSQTRAQASLP